MARSLDRPMRYFLAKRQEGPALFVADRIDTLQRALEGEGLGRPVSSKLHPHDSGAPRRRNRARRLPGPRPDLHAVLHARTRDARRRISTRSAGVTLARWPTKSPSGCGMSMAVGAGEPIGVTFSGGIDSGSVFLCSTTRCSGWAWRQRD